MKKIKFIKGDIEIMGFGKTEAGKTCSITHREQYCNRS